MKYNPNKTHQRDTKAFKNLTFKEQALSINGTIVNLERAMRLHAQHGEKQRKQSARVTIEKCIRQVKRLADRLQK